MLLMQIRSIKLNKNNINTWFDLNLSKDLTCISKQKFEMKKETK